MYARAHCGHEAVALGTQGQGCVGQHFEGGLVGQGVRGWGGPRGDMKGGEQSSVDHQRVDECKRTIESDARYSQWGWKGKKVETLRRKVKSLGSLLSTALKMYI